VHTTTRFCLAVLYIAVLTASAAGLPFTVVTKAHLLSMGLGVSSSVPSAADSTGLRVPNGWTSDRRILDLGLGARLSQQYSVVVQVAAVDILRSYYYWFPTYVTLTGVTFVRCGRFGPAPRALALTASVRGTVLGLGGTDLLDLCVGANATAWVVNPELEVGFRREWKGGCTDPRLPPRHDRVFALIRVGLGGWYEFGRN
jgi:hypothetical protein